MSTPARGFIGSQVLGMVGSAVGSDDPTGAGSSGLHQYVDVSAAGMVYAHARSDDPSYPNPKLGIAKWSSANAAAMNFNNITGATLQTGYGGVVQNAISVAAAERVLIVVGNALAGKAIVRPSISYMPQIAAPNFSRTRNGVNKSDGWLYLEPGGRYYPWNAVMWYRRAGETLWSQYSAPIRMGTSTIQCMTTAEGYTESPFNTADI